MFRVVEAGAPSPRVRALLDGTGLFFPQPRWIDALVAAYPRFRARYLAVEEDGEVTGALPLVETTRAGVLEVLSLPFGSHGGPVLAPGADPEGARMLAREYRLRISRARVFRHALTAFALPEAVERALDEQLGGWREPGETWLIGLDGGAEAVWDRYEGRARTAVRKARKSGVTAGIETGPEAVEAFYTLQRAQGLTRPIPWHHRRQALGTIVDAMGEDARIWIARHEGRPVCGALVVSRPGCEAHPWLTGALPEARPVNAFQLLMHEAMADAAESGIPLWNFGPSAGRGTVEYFKTAFGGRPRTFLRYHHEARWVRWARRFAR